MRGVIPPLCAGFGADQSLIADVSPLNASMRSGALRLGGAQAPVLFAAVEPTLSEIAC